MPGTETPVTTDEELFCYAHRDTPTRLRCSRCDRPICGRCAIPASVGQHCPECVAEAQRAAPRVRGAVTGTAPVVVAIIVVNILVYVAQQASSGVTDRFAAVALAIQAGEYHRLVTAMFLHSPSSILHILFNMYVLYSFGPHVEKAFGSLRFAAMYLTAGFAGSAISFAFGACGLRSVGASGAIFGVVGILGAFLYSRRTSAVANLYLRNIGIFVALNLVLGFSIPNIDWLAHLGGLAGGIALGFGFDRVAERSSAPVTVQIATTGAVLGLSVALVVWKSANFFEVCGF